MRAAVSVLFAILVSATAVAGQPVAGMQWSAPPTWRAEAAQAMRAATYSVRAVPGDRARAECAIYFFGKDQGGSVEANLDRWKGQFTLASGSPAPARVATRTSQGLKITTLDTAGSFSGLGGPMRPSASGGAVPGYRLLGAIVEGPGGNIFIKFTGPERTIGANQLQFEQLLASFHPVR